MSFRDGWTIQQVATPNDLKAEGNMMNHCVGTYCDDVASGKTRIFSLRDPQNHPHVTIELQGDSDKIVQVQGNSNQDPSEDYDYYIEQFFRNLDNPQWAEGSGPAVETPSFYGMNTSEIAAAMEKNLGEKDKYGIPSNVLELNVRELIDDVFNALEHTWDASWRGWDGVASELGDVIRRHDDALSVQTVQNYDPSKSDYYALRKFDHENGFEHLKDKFDEYMTPIIKELNDTAEAQFLESDPEPDEDDYLPDYRDYDNDEAYDEDYSKAQKRFDQDHKQWERHKEYRLDYLKDKAKTDHIKENVVPYVASQIIDNQEKRADTLRNGIWTQINRKQRQYKEQMAQQSELTAV
jgi:hypothetical protein